MPEIVVLKEFDALYGDSSFKLRVRLLSRNKRMPVLDVRWFDLKEKEFTTRGISFPTARLDNLRLLLTAIDEVPQLIAQYREEQKNVHGKA